jgi:hypothetical protein
MTSKRSRSISSSNSPFLTPPHCHANDGMNFMPGQGPGQLSRYVLIEQSPQGCA